MPTTRSPTEKAAIFGAGIVGIWAACKLLGDQELLRGILQPLVLAFMLTGVMSLFVEWVEFPFKLFWFIAAACCSKAKRKLCMCNMCFRGKDVALKTPLVRKDTDGSATELRSVTVLEKEQRNTEWFKGCAQKAVMNSPLALKYAPLEIRKNKDIVLEAIKRDPNALWYASSTLRDSKEVVIQAVSINGLVLAAASDRLKGNDEVVQEALAENGEALQFVKISGRGKKKPLEETHGKCSTSMGNMILFKRMVEKEVGTNPLLRAIAVVIAVILVYRCAAKVIKLLASEMQGEDNLTNLIIGLNETKNLIEQKSGLNLSAYTNFSNPEQIVNEIRENVNFDGLGKSVLSLGGKMIMQTIMCTIYTLILLIAPLAEITTVLETVRSYFARKTASNLIYSAVAWALLASLENPLYPLLVFVTFFLSYIPEIGAFITVVLPAPFFLLAVKLDMTTRLQHMVIGLVGMIINKFAVGNGFEAVIMGMGSAGGGDDDAKEATHTHAVVMIVIVLFGGVLWGATGTLFAVPATWLVQAYFREDARLYEIEQCQEMARKAKEHPLLTVT